MEFHAHRDQESGKVHRLSDHLEGTGDMAARFSDPWGAADLARVAGLWHDLGKYAPEFQEMINAGDPDAHLEDKPSGPKKKRRVNHSSAGALWAVEQARLANECGIGRVLAYIIAGHHAGLPDWDPPEGGRGLKDRLKQSEHLTRALDAGPDPDILNMAIPKLTWVKGKDLSLWIRMLASALFDADFLDTEAFYDQHRAADRRVGWDSPGDLAKRLDTRLRQFADTAGEVNRVRADVLAGCRRAAESPPGLFSLTVPTGGGKTLSSLAFALKHMRRHGLRRVIYAVPFTSIIEQTAEVFRKALGSLGQGAVLEHHSALDPDGNTARSRLAAENWDAPLIVTTTVQLFESLFAARTSRVRKLHNISRSVLILDEAQALPPAVLRPVTIVLDQLVRFYGVTVVLCTATQPALSAVFRKLGEPREIAPDPPRLFADLERKRVRTEWEPDPISWENLAKMIEAEDSSLTIVNSRRDARSLIDLLPERTVHMSTWQCPAHRRKLLRKIKEDLKNGRAVRVVSTTLVEAGVDIDFPVVFRALSGLDSLAQAAGRCNREGKLINKLGRFVVFRPEGEGGLPKHVLTAAGVTEATLKEFGNDCFTPEAFKTYFEKMYRARGEDALDAYGMKKLLNLGEETIDLDLSFRTAAREFRMIDDGQKTVVIQYDNKAEKLIGELRGDGASRKLLRRLQAYTVPLTRWDFKALEDTRVTETLDGITILLDHGLYKSDVGLDVPTLGAPSLKTINI